MDNDHFDRRTRLGSDLFSRHFDRITSLVLISLSSQNDKMTSLVSLSGHFGKDNDSGKDNETSRITRPYWVSISSHIDGSDYVV